MRALVATLAASLLAACASQPPKPTPELVAEPATKLVAEPIIKLVAEPIPKRVAEPAPKPVAEPARKPAPVDIVIACDHRLLSCRSAKSDYIVLLPGAGGKTGAVAVRQNGREVVLDRAYASVTASSDGRLEAGQSSAAEVNREFGVAIATAPPAPASFVVYFSSGRDELAGEYEIEIKRLLEEMTRRASPEVTVIGHTDRVGTDKANDALGLKRAERVRRILMQRGVPAGRIIAASRGEREPLAPTADEVTEPRNRRVEISVR